MAQKKPVIRKRRERKNIERGAAHIQSTFNTVSYTHLPGIVIGKGGAEIEKLRLECEKMINKNRAEKMCIRDRTGRWHWQTSARRHYPW